MKISNLLLSVVSPILVSGNLLAADACRGHGRASCSSSSAVVHMKNGSLSIAKEKIPQRLSLVQIEKLEQSVTESVIPTPVKFDEFPNFVFYFQGLSFHEVNTGLKYQKYKDSITHFQLESLTNQTHFPLKKDEAGYSFKCYFRAILTGNPEPSFENYILLKLQCRIANLDSVLK